MTVANWRAIRRSLREERENQTPRTRDSLRPPPKAGTSVPGRIGEMRKSAEFSDPITEEGKPP
jgi:hypothetical protein